MHNKQHRRKALVGPQCYSARENETQAKIRNS